MTPADQRGRYPHWLHLGSEVREALAAGQPVVALESTVISHGLPSPINLEVAGAMEANVRAAGAVPATIGIVAGRATVGLDATALESFATREGIEKASSRDLAGVIASGAYGATTVAGTLALAQMAGISIMATGGIGGVHRGASQSGDVSADLGALARSSLTVVASGAKCILDLPRTLECLETLGVTVVGYQTDVFPAFYYRDSGLALDQTVDDEAAAAELLVASEQLRSASVRLEADAPMDGHSSVGNGLIGGVLLANPIPPEAALDRAYVEQCIARAEDQAAEEGVAGKAVTPFLLSALAAATQGQSLAANVALLKANASLAGRIATRVAELRAAALD